jgi:hypothetical protein
MNQHRPGFALFVVMTVLTGVVYPLLVTGIAQAVFPVQANGSLLAKDGAAVGVHPHRTAVRRPEVLLEPALRDVTSSLQRRVVVGIEPGPAERHASGRGPWPAGRSQGRRSSQPTPRPRGPRDGLGKRSRPEHQPGGCPLSGEPGGEGARSVRGDGPGTRGPARPAVGHPRRARRRRPLPQLGAGRTRDEVSIPTFGWRTRPARPLDSLPDHRRGVSRSASRIAAIRIAGRRHARHLLDERQARSMLL